MSALKINLQNKTACLEGHIRYMWFENKTIGLEKTLFHSISIPLEPFDSGFEHVDQPEKPSIDIEWLNLNLADPNDLDGVEISIQPDGDAQASIYIGGAHNPIDIDSLVLKHVQDNLFEITAKAMIDFEYEGIAQNEFFEVSTTVVLKQ